jgi:glucose/mannose-6-phosphate isomerase
VIDLDDARTVATADPSGMLDAIMAMPDHCRQGYAVGREADDLPSAQGLTSLAVCGMGGSGVSGDVVQALYHDRLGLPVAVVKGPVLPGFCGKDTLVLCSSVSGNTAETLACFQEAAARGCRLVAITSGGELGRLAREEAVALVPVPANLPAPRAAVGHVAFGTLGALERIGVIPSAGEEVEHTARVLEALAKEIGPRVPSPHNRAKALAGRIGDRTPVVWGGTGVAAVAATRWKTQLNENAKVPAFCSVMPELNHNEVVGWGPGTGQRFLLLVLRHQGEHPEMAALFPASIALVVESGLAAEEIWAPGDSPLSALMSLIMLGDAMTAYLGLLHGVDPTPIEAITRLKRTLAAAGVSEPTHLPQEEPEVHFEPEGER